MDLPCTIASVIDIDLSELQGAVEWVSDSTSDGEAFICRRTGRIYWISDEDIVDQEDPPSDLDDPMRFVPVPDKYELDIGTKLAFDYTNTHLPDRYNEVRSIFRRRGAYGRFKSLLSDHRLLEGWYAYCDEKTQAALQEWCKSEGLIDG